MQASLICLEIKVISQTRAYVAHTARLICTLWHEASRSIIILFNMWLLLTGWVYHRQPFNIHLAKRDNTKQIFSSIQYINNTVMQRPTNLPMFKSNQADAFTLKIFFINHALSKFAFICGLRFLIHNLLILLCCCYSRLSLPSVQFKKQVCCVWGNWAHNHELVSSTYYSVLTFVAWCCVICWMPLSKTHFIILSFFLISGLSH